jgi:hypothetical protein
MARKIALRVRMRRVVRRMQFLVARIINFGVNQPVLVLAFLTLKCAMVLVIALITLMSLLLAPSPTVRQLCAEMDVRFAVINAMVLLIARVIRLRLMNLDARLRVVLPFLIKLLALGLVLANGALSALLVLMALAVFPPRTSVMIITTVLMVLTRLLLDYLGDVLCPPMCAILIVSPMVVHVWATTTVYAPTIELEQIAKIVLCLVM